MKYISILGATGSIGTQTIDVLRQSRNDFSLLGISAHKSYDKVINIIKEFNPKFVAMTEEIAFNKVKDYCRINNLDIEVTFGMDGLNKIATIPEAHIVVTSVVGMVGLIPTLKAINAGKHIALANKETLVVGGSLVTEAAKKNNVLLLPVDSEHGAIFQCLYGNNAKEVSKIILTASGGPFRGKTLKELQNVSLKEALNHPKWKMGSKITIDSATLMNKGLEVIEAHWLFNAAFENIQVVVHPQSIIHSMVEYIDGSVLAQLGPTDMRLPIQYALNYPLRKIGVAEKLDFYNLSSLTFEKPDTDTFKCLRLAYEAGKTGGTMPAILNAANEACVNLFLKEKITFLKIGDIIEECMNKFTWVNNFKIEDILEIDKKVKNFVLETYGD
ncbi:1-deoxy-D-xylulose-5-phosphate reductoisomerase [Candidatus Clostridium radicumherbarum]|uniref:1-deoxy-D-xylulose 5-phosphate reductoisomerase n=1 Tax=Candidatus Clostridium radicumherbarum TaxID=3381662 RepID=A0ABW8TUB1_9CLOT